MTTALLILDMQVALLMGAFREVDVVRNAQAIVRSAREAKAPVVYVQHNHASFEPTDHRAPQFRIAECGAPIQEDHRHPEQRGQLSMRLLTLKQVMEWALGVKCSALMERKEA
jgi:nicotinamidase-related amidase